jgi:hypothetical protein
MYFKDPAYAYLLIVVSRYSSISKVTDYGLEELASISGRCRDNSLRYYVQTGYGEAQSLHSIQFVLLHVFSVTTDV